MRPADVQPDTLVPVVTMPLLAYRRATAGLPEPAVVRAFARPERAWDDALRSI